MTVYKQQDKQQWKILSTHPNNALHSDTSQSKGDSKRNKSDVRGDCGEITSTYYIYNESMCGMKEQSPCIYR